MWFLKHTREHRFITCRSYTDALTQLYMQWRDRDGSIPWTIEYED